MEIYTNRQYIHDMKHAVGTAPSDPLRCDECGREVKRVVLLSNHQPGRYDETVGVCLDCLHDATALLAPTARKESH